MPDETISPAPQAGGGKSKKKNKKKGAAKAKVEADKETGENAYIQTEDAGREQTGQGSKPMSPTATDHTPINGIVPNNDGASMGGTEKSIDAEVPAESTDKRASTVDVGKPPAENSSPSPESDPRFEALVRDRDSLRAEVTEMRKSLEQIQSKHAEEMGSLQHKLEETQEEKEHAESRFRDLLGKVNTIKSQLGERLKADAEELTQARARIDELESQKDSLKGEVEAKSAEISSLHKEGEERSKELSSLRNRTNLSQQNWVKEREELVEREDYLRTEFEEAKQAMHNWEILAMDERSIRENLGEKVIDLEDQLSSLREEYEKVSSESNTQSVTVDGLQKALQEIQAARKQELREVVESSDAQIEELRKKLQEAEEVATDANAKLETTEAELQRALPFEKEVREKNLLIGKLRHEAVTLNEHLTKALRFLKKGKPEDNVDRNLVTNHLLHFLALDRSDPKKFQILQLISALLGWNEEQREQAGLARPGTASTFGSLRVPGSPMHRTPSTPSLVTDFFSDSSSSKGKESLAELWSNFLEQEAQSTAGQPESRSRSTSQEQKPSSP